MPKKKQAKEIPAGETLHFRPGPELGRLLANFADERQLSRGDAAKRLLGLAVRGLGINCYDDVAELMNYTYDDFDHACEMVFIVLVTEEERNRKAGQKMLDELDKLAVVKQVVHSYRVSRGLGEPVEEKRQQVRVTRTMQG